MTRLKAILLALGVVALIGGGVWAQQANGLSGTVGIETDVLPAFTTELWVDLDWAVDGWTIGNRLDLDILPEFGASWMGSVDVTFAPVDLGLTAIVDIVPFDVVDLSFDAGIDLFEMTQDGFAASADAGLNVGILPGFDATASLDLDASYGVFSLWGDVDLTIPGFAVTTTVGGEARVLDLDLDDGSLIADLGASSQVIPDVDAQLWFDVAFDLRDLGVTSQTDIGLTPFELTQQRFDVELSVGPVTVYAWLGFDGAGELSGGLGGTYDFPAP